MNETPVQYPQRVVGYLEGKDSIEVLSATPREFQALIERASRKSLDAKPASGKWSATMILAHLADSEIVYGCRLRLMLAASGITIQATDQDVWAETFDYATQDPARFCGGLSSQPGADDSDAEEAVGAAVELL